MSTSLLFSYDIENFCTPDSLDASVNYTNLLLTSYGYPVPIVPDSTDVEDQCKTVNCMYALINDRKKDMQERQQLIDKINELYKDQEEMKNSLVNHKRDHAVQEKKIKELSSKLGMSEKECNKQRNQNARLKEQVTKATNDLKYIKTQYAHETKRHEQDMAKVQERLLKLMNNQFKTNTASISMNSHFATTLDYAADNDEVVQVRSMYTDLLLKSTNRESEAIKESGDLRIALVQLYTGVRRLIEDKIQQFDRERQTEKRNAYQETTRFNLPMDCGGKEALKEIENLLVRLREEWDYQIMQIANQDTKDETQEDTTQTLVDTVNELLREIEDMTIENDGKLKVYQRYEQGGFFDVVMPELQPTELSDSESSVTDFQLDNVLKYKSLRKKVMKERRKVTEAAEELGNQRVQLQAERWAVQKMKYELQKKEILEEPVSSTSSVNSDLSRIGPSRPHKRFKPSFFGTPSNK